MGRARIFIGDSELRNWTSMKLSRKKKDLTGNLNVNIFMGNIPGNPIYINAVQGQDIRVYIDNQLAFYGIIDKRNGSSSSQSQNARRQILMGKSNNAPMDGKFQYSLGKNGYKITLTARGQTKRLIDCSHTHKTGTFRDKTDRKAVEELIKEYGLELDWQSDEIPIDRFVLRDGATVIDEIQRICNENCKFVYETRDGKLRITDKALQSRGEALILGKNILTFEAEQSEDRANSEIHVKGHRNKRGIWGQNAILDPIIRIKDNWVKSYSPLVIQHYGDATTEALQRRAKWEADKRSSESKRVTIDVFDIDSETGVPWDIGLIHYIEVPPEGIFTDMECIELTYNVENDGTLQTQLVLAPPPSSAKNTAEANALLAEPVFEKTPTAGVNAASNMNVNVYPFAWSSALLAPVSTALTRSNEITNLLLTMPENMPQKPPLTIEDIQT